jgi:hypothetical protein
MKASAQVEARGAVGPVEEWTTGNLLDLLKQRYSLETDYQLYKLLDVRPQTIYRYRSHRGTFDDDVALRVAGLLGIDPKAMLACVARDRSRNADARNWWNQIAKHLAVGVAAVALAPLVLGAPEAAAAALRNGNYVPAPALDQGGIDRIYIMRGHRGRRRKGAGAWIGAALLAFLHGSATA